MKLTKLERIKIGVRQQWRWGVLRHEIKDIGDGLVTILEFLSIGILATVLTALSPLAILWRFTVGMLWTALTCQEEHLMTLKRMQDKRKGDAT